MFASSSHAQRWLLDERTLSARRRAAHDRALFVLAGGAAELPVPAAEAAAGADSNATVSPLSPEELSGCLSAIAAAVEAVCLAQDVPPPEKVVSAATYFFKRFYVDQSMLLYPPGAIATVCVYVACKTENFYIDAAVLCKKTREVDSETMLAMEGDVLSMLQFDLCVWHPHHAVHGFVADIAASGDVDMDGAQQASILGAAVELCRAWLRTDASLLFSPQAIAVAAVSRAAGQAGVDVAGCVRAWLAALNLEPGTLARVYAVVDSRMDRHVARAVRARVERFKAAARAHAGGRL